MIVFAFQCFNIKVHNILAFGFVYAFIFFIAKVLFGIAGWLISTLPGRYREVLTIWTSWLLDALKSLDTEIFFRVFACWDGNTLIFFFWKIQLVAFTLRNTFASSFFFVEVELDRADNIILANRIFHIEILIFWALGFGHTSFHINVEVKAYGTFRFLNAFLAWHRIIVSSSTAGER